MGMVDSQSRNSDALDAHVNASLTALNLAKVTLRQEMTVPDQPMPDVMSFSIESFNNSPDSFLEATAECGFQASNLR